MEIPVSKRSKRFHKGSIHHIQGGRIRILDRFQSEEDDLVYLKFEYMDTDPKQVLIKKEVNVSSNIYKYNRIMREKNLQETPTNSPTNEGSEDIYTEILADLTAKIYDLQCAQEAKNVSYVDAAESFKVTTTELQKVSELMTSNTTLYRTLAMVNEEMARLSTRFAKQAVEMDEYKIIIKSQQETIAKLSSKL